MASLLGISIAGNAISFVCGMAVEAAVPLSTPGMRKGRTSLPDPYNEHNYTKYRVE